MSLQRREQKGPYRPANQSPSRLQVGHLIFIDRFLREGNLARDRPVFIFGRPLGAV
jgi:hypothetical protein